MKGPTIENGLVVGNAFDKYNTRNPFARWLMRGFFSAFDDLVSKADASSVFEIGCGEGELALRCAKRGIPTRGTDISQRMIRLATERAATLGLEVDFAVADLFQIHDLSPPAELVICCEVLEHLAEPKEALAHLRTLGGSYYLMSVPQEPLWRIMNMLRGRYLTDLGNTPGHLQHWSHNGFLRLVSTEFAILAVRSPTPWTMVLATPRPYRVSPK